MPVALELIVGGLLLFGGGEALVRGGVAAAARLGVSPLLIGLTLVGFGTSTPELVASLQAALIGAPGIAVGNVVGSNIANILLILGLAAVIFPIATTRGAFRRDGTMLLASAAALIVAAMTGVVGPPAGIVFLLLLAAYVVFTYRTERRRPDAGARMHAAEAEEFAGPAPMPLALGLALAAAGIAGVVLGAGLLVGAALTVAREAGLSEAVIGLTLVAVGTSLPELATSVMAALRRHADVAFGNIVGSNIFNALGIMGATALVTPIEVPRQFLVFDLWVMLGVSVLLVIFAATGLRLNRWEGGAFLALYALYLGLQAWVPTALG